MGENDSLDEIRNNKLDSAFKEVMSLADILSNTLEPLVTELKGMEPEEIRKCLPLEKDGDRIVKLEQEIPTPDGNAIRLDVLFELKTPGNKHQNRGESRGAIQEETKLSAPEPRRILQCIIDT